MAFSPTLDAIRARFPSLSGDFAFLENAGGSQVPASVADAIRDYMLSSYVQLGAGYPKSKQATDVVDRAHEFMETFMNGAGIGKVILGPSTTALTNILANAYGETIRPGDEVIIAETNHEANAGPWDRLARNGAIVKTWRVDPATFQCSLSDLATLLTKRTRIVALPHVSNLLGHIVELRAICDLAHMFGARVVADGVAYAPHRAIDVQALGVDWYVFSTYKVYGPHMAALFGTYEAIQEVDGPNHFFIPKDSLPYKFELGGACHEGCAGLLAVGEYLAFLGGHETFSREAVNAAYALMTELELPLQKRLIEYLKSKASVKIIGRTEGDAGCVGTVSFVSDRVPSNEIAAYTDDRHVGIRNGHMYAYRLCEALGIPTDPGVTRVSFLHYNTLGEIDRLVSLLDQVL